MRRLVEQPISFTSGGRMIKRICSIIVACVLTLSTIGQQTTSASSKPDKDTRFAEKVKAAIVQLGAGLLDLSVRSETLLS
jgi:hypothetical protein